MDALLSSEDMDVHRVVILAPVNTLHNWMNEIEMWIPDRDFGVSQNDQPIFVVGSEPGRNWFDWFGVYVL